MTSCAHWQLGADPATVQPHPFLVITLRQPPSMHTIALSGAPVWSGGKNGGQGGSKSGRNGGWGEDGGEDGDEKENDDGTEVRVILMPATVEDGESLVNMLSLPALSITPNELASSADADSELTPWTEAEPPRLLHRSPKRKRSAPDPLLADETALFRFPQQVRFVWMVGW